MKISLFDAEDLKAIEDTIFRGMVRALRVAARENLISGYVPPEEKPPEAPEEPAMRVNGAAHGTMPFGALMHGGNAAPERMHRRPLTDFCPIVNGCRPGFIPANEARHLIGGLDGPANTMLRKWLMEGQVHGVIDTAVQPPTKGLPGRLMVHKQELITRNEVRKRNAALPPGQRQHPAERGTQH